MSKELDKAARAATHAATQDTTQDTTNAAIDDITEGLPNE